MDDIAGKTSLDGKPVARICQILNSAGVPNVLWGNYLLTIYGVPTIIDDVAFIVPDDRITAASSALAQANFTPCGNNLNCDRSYRFQARPPLEHFHMSDVFVLSLYQKSDTLWELTDLDSPTSENAASILSASDPSLPSAAPGRGQGRLSSEYSAVRVPAVAKFCESLLLLMCRDYNTTYETYWMALLTYIIEYVDETDSFSAKDLGYEFRKFYCAVKEADASSMWPLLEELRSNLFSSGRLPNGQNL
ncbi:thioredoxin reductase [Beauveria brongniartii RCEF 3172]|uniref:Thioredoxin reductase n=1 Tax=Beauveria brongniartii RCEF 3172 TaxID=1081107 RepID=A0A168EWW7_9HYPO|nr:thioredoxin reductase [Beauveria brongniartii RCEF 3172]